MQFKLNSRVRRAKPLPIVIAIGVAFLLFFSGVKLLSKPTPVDLYKLTSKTLNLPNLTGPEFLCFSYGGKSVIGVFTGGGDPDLDVYTWKIIAPDGSLISTYSGGGLLQNINYTFSSPGAYKVELQIKRGVLVFPVQVLNVRVQERPQPTLNPTYSFCGIDPLELQAISPSTPFFSNYEFEWRNQSGTIVGSQNKIQITQAGNYTATVFIRNSKGSAECTTVVETQVKDSNNIQLQASSNSFCSDQSIQFSTNPSANGSWFVKKVGSTMEFELAKNTSGITLSPSNLTNGFGNYEIIFEVNNPDAVNCKVRKTKEITYYPQPDFILLDPLPSTGCEISDGGIVVQAITAIDYIYIENSNIKTPSLSPGQTYTITGVGSGAYNLISVLGGCINSYASVVPLGNPPPELEFNLLDINGETCTPDGRLNGDFLVDLINGPVDGIYRVLDLKGGTVTGETFSNRSELLISLPGGKYVFELYNLDSCSFPKEEFIEIPGKSLVEYSIPGDLLICQSAEITPQSNQNLEYELIAPSGKSDLRKANEPFTITEQGEHKIIGRDPINDEFCPVSKFFEVTLVDPVDFQIVLTQEDCLGNRTYQADIMGRDSTTVIFTWYNEKDEIVGNSQFLNPISTGKFKLDVQPSNSSSCPVPPKSFIISEPILSMNVSLSATQLCEVGPKAIITAGLEYPDEVTNIEWRRFDENGDIEDLPQFVNQKEIEIDQSGTYEAAVYSIKPEINKNCELGRESIIVELNLNRVEFTVPSEISFCEETVITPSYNQDLVFEILTPDGKTETFTSGGSFNLNQSGNYEVYAFDPSPTPTLCPDLQIIAATKREKITFEPKFVTQSCAGDITYKADIGTTPVSAVLFEWTNSSGVVVETQQTFITKTPGIYYLNVQPAGSLPCVQQPVSFEVIAPILSLPLQLITQPLCPDAESAAIVLKTDLEQVTTIKWTYFTTFGEPSVLTFFANKNEILANREGTYKVEIFNSFGCLLGEESVLILRSQDNVRPVVEETYLICPRYEIGPTINPGTFSSYEWYFEGQKVSTDPTFKPLQLGEYQVVVFSLEGCAYETSFTTEEECELKVMYPTAITPGDPEKPFLVYTNYLIDELEVWIFNQWGELIFNCSNKDLISEESTCVWDGTYNGKKIINGSYSVRLNYVNYEKNIRQKTIGSIIAIE
jgi:hypothetical protein